MARLTRRDFLKGAAAAVAAGVSLPADASTNDLAHVEEHEFTVPGLEPAHHGLRVVQLSDLHCGPRTPPGRILDAVACANSLEPDLVVLTGDYLCRDESGVGLMRSLLGGITAPTVAVLGNHDHWVDAPGATRALERHGYAVLRNQNTTVTLRGSPFTVIGIDDFMTGHAQPAEALAGAPAESRIVLAHCPRTVDALRRIGEPLLCFSGHTHGGQLNIPVLTRFMLRAFAHEPYSRGPYHVGPVQLYVNRGIGNSALRLRVNATPEITLATLRSAAA